MYILSGPYNSNKSLEELSVVVRIPPKQPFSTEMRKACKCFFQKCEFYTVGVELDLALGVCHQEILFH